MQQSSFQDIQKEQAFPEQRSPVQPSEQHMNRKLWYKVLNSVFLIMLVCALFCAHWSLDKLHQTRQVLAELKAEAWELVQEKDRVENALKEIQQKLEETEAEFRKSFNILYPAYVATVNVRYVGAGSEVYHRYDCEVFSQQYSVYTAHNTEYCEKLDYTPCFICCD